MPNPDSPADAEWDALLHQWRTATQAPPAPYFYQRVRARLVARAAPPSWGLPPWLRRPAYVAALALLGAVLSGDCAALATVRPAPPAAAPAPPLPAGR